MTGMTQRPYRFYVLALAVGFVIGIGPLVSTLPKDPFDRGINYAVWGAGLFLASISLSFIGPGRVWRSALFVALGLPAALIFVMAFVTGPSNLFPLSVIFSLMVALIPSMAGAFIGRSIQWIGDRIRGRK
jgi:membrane protease YdiL (CAAX protease family)